MQTLNSISAENNSTIVFPVPIDIMSNFMQFSQNTNQLSPEQYQQYQQMLNQYQEQHYKKKEAIPPPTSKPKPTSMVSISKNSKYEQIQIFYLGEFKVLNFK